MIASKKPAWVSSERAIRELGMPQSPVEGALSKSAEWFTAHGYVESKKDGKKS